MDDFLRTTLEEVGKIRKEIVKELQKIKINVSWVPLKNKHKYLGIHFGQADYNKKRGKITIVKDLPLLLKKYIMIHEIVHLYHFAKGRKTSPWYNRVIEEIRTYIEGTILFLLSLH